MNDTKDKDFGLSDFEADELASLTNDLMEYTEKLMERVNVAKNHQSENIALWVGRITYNVHGAQIS